MYYLKYPLTGPTYIRIFSKEIVQLKKRLYFLQINYIVYNFKNYKSAFTNFHDKGTYPMNKFTVFH